MICSQRKTLANKKPRRAGLVDAGERQILSNEKLCVKAVDK